MHDHTYPGYQGDRVGGYDDELVFGYGRGHQHGWDDFLSFVDDTGYEYYGIGWHREDYCDAYHRNAAGANGCRRGHRQRIRRWLRRGRRRRP